MIAAPEAGAAQGDLSMNSTGEWGAAVSQLGARLADYLPSVLGAVLLLLVGWLVARVLRSVAAKLMSLLELVINRVSRGRGAASARVPSASVEIVASILFWVVILFFVAAATEVLGLDLFSSWLKQLVAYLPTLFAGALIMLAGFLMSGLARDLTAAALGSAPEAQRHLLARLVQGTILVTAVVVGADQIGIKVTFLVIMAAIVLSAVTGGVVLAMSLGARTYVSNLIGAHYLRQSYGIGQTVRVGGYEGKILEVTAVSLVLESPQGRVTLPAKIFHEEAVVLVVKDNNG